MGTKPNPPETHPKVLHPGSSVEDAKAVGGQGDFGAKESNVVERTYTSRNTKLADPGNSQPRGGEGGSRTSGVGGNDSGPGSSSGGDLDTDIVGIGTGAGLSASLEVDAAGPDDAAATSEPQAAKRITTRAQVDRGSTMQSEDANTIAPQGADAASTPEGDLDDSFTGEVSRSEASGADDAGV